MRCYRHSTTISSSRPGHQLRRQNIFYILEQGELDGVRSQETQAKEKGNPKVKRAVADKVEALQKERRRRQHLANESNQDPYPGITGKRQRVERSNIRIFRCPATTEKDKAKKQGQDTRRRSSDNEKATRQSAGR